MSLNKISHIGIAVKSIDAWKTFYQDTLGFSYLGEEIVESEQVRVAFFQIGESRIELLEPLDETSPIAVHIQKRDEGFHHLAYEVDQIEQDIKELQEKGLTFIQSTPKNGAHQSKIAFLHPASTGKVLVELCQPQSKEE
jgi:methylmalonyl-CoA epimerase